MPRFTILPTDRSRPPMDLIAGSSASVLHMLSRHHCIEADVLKDGRYAFSLRTSEGGSFWTIFQRARGKRLESAKRKADAPGETLQG